MRGLYFSLCYSWRKTVHSSEHLLMDSILLDTQRDESTAHIPQKRRWPTNVKVGFSRNAEFFEAGEIQVPSNVEVVSKSVGRVWFAVCDCRMTTRNTGKQLPGLMGKDMIPSVTRRMDPPNFV